MSLRSTAIALSAIFWSVGLGAANADTVTVYWDNVALNYVERNPTPRVASAMLTTVHTAMYDAWTAYDSIAVPTRANGILKRPPEEMTDSNKIEAISFAAHKALVYLLPAMASRIDAALTELGYDLDDVTNTDTATPPGIGNVAAAAVIARYGPDRLVGDPLSFFRYALSLTPDSFKDRNTWQPLRRVEGGRFGVVQQDAGR
jgi:hypothetical protein